MARAKKIYVVFVSNTKDSLPFATFTVKRECKEWIKKNEQALIAAGVQNIGVLTFPDGGFPVDVTKEANGFLESVVDISSEFADEDA